MLGLHGRAKPDPVSAPWSWQSSRETGISHCVLNGKFQMGISSLIEWVYESI